MTSWGDDIHMDWLSDATGGGDISNAIDAITAGGIVAFCLIPTFTLLIIIALIVKIVKWRKAKKNKHKEKVNNSNKQNTTNKSKIQDVQLGKGTKNNKTKNHHGLGLTSAQLHAELGYDTVDTSVLDNIIKEPEHSMDLNMTFDSNGKNKKKK